MVIRFGGEGFEEAFEGTMHVETGVGCGEELAELGREILFDGSAAAVELGMGTAEVAGGGGHAALATVGKLKLAKVVGGVLPSGGHRESVATKSCNQ